MTAITKTRTYSETQTATLFGVIRQTLGLWRKAGKLRPDLILTGIRPQGQGSGVTYDADLVDLIVEGVESPFPEVVV